MLFLYGALAGLVGGGALTFLYGAYAKRKAAALAAAAAAVKKA